jgi:GR25 family glycosyltransferase involved in LPS biosynthesis
MSPRAEERACLLEQDDPEKGVEPSPRRSRPGFWTIAITIGLLSFGTLIAYQSTANRDAMDADGAGLGRHHHHHHHKDDDAAAPWISGDGQGARLASFEPDSTGDAESFTSQRKVDKLKVPVYIMGDGVKGSEDEKSRAETIGTLVGIVKQYTGMDDDDINSVIKIQDSVYPAKWPETLDSALDAIGSFGMKKSELENVQWFAPVLEASRRDGHKCDFEFCEKVAHHIGCLLTHVLIWKQAMEKQQEHFVVMESDAYRLHSVSPLDLNNLVDNLPGDADLVWLKPDEFDSGQLVKRFRSNAMGTWPANSIHQTMYNQQNFVYLYKFNKRCGWAGTPEYMLTKKGLAKIMEHIKNEEEVDMIDAWMGAHCLRKCDDPRRCMNLNCYIAQTMPVAKEVLGGYVPDWYDDQNDDQDVREVDKEIVESLDDDHDGYNRMACERHGSTFGGWAPIGQGETSSGRKVIQDCMAFPWEQHHINFCEQKFPLDSLDMSMLGDSGTASLGYQESREIARSRILQHGMATLGLESTTHGTKHSKHV